MYDSRFGDLPNREYDRLMDSRDEPEPECEHCHDAEATRVLYAPPWVLHLCPACHAEAENPDLAPFA